MHRPLLASITLAVALGATACGGGGAAPTEVDLASDAGTAVTIAPPTGASSSDDSTATSTSAPVAAAPPTTVATPASGAAGTAGASEVPGETDAGESDPATAAGTVAAWVEALATGDTDRAWALTHVASRDAFGGRTAFDDAASALAEGYGAWAGSDDVDYEVTPLPAAGPAVDIVVLRGTVAEEGPPTERVEAVPVRQDADGFHQVDPFQDLLGEGGLEHQPEDGASIEPSHRFEVYLAGGRSVSLVVDDEVLDVTTESADGDRQRVTGRPRQPLAPGVHALTVVVERDGAVQARSILTRVG